MQITAVFHRKGLRLATGVLLAMLLLAAGFFWYVSDYYRAEDAALDVLASGENIEVRGSLTILSPSYPTDTAIIFYPGAKVEGAAYLPLLDQLRRTGLTCILVEMPFRMAIFDVNAAEDVMAQFPEIRHWYLAGHSMGGAMASQFAAGHRDQVDGLILLGAYLYGEYPSADTLTVYGSLNQSVEDKIDYTEHVVEIDGGNHAQFGSYGLQRGDHRRRSRLRNSRPGLWRPSPTSSPSGRRDRRSLHPFPQALQALCRSPGHKSKLTGVSLCRLQQI